MGNERKKCSICKEDYMNTDSKKPVMLTLCGHTYCRSCLCQLEEAGKKACPSCRTDWSKLRAEELPVCFQLLPGEDERLALKQMVENEEKRFSEMRRTTKDALEDVVERIFAVRDLMQSASTYLDSLDIYQSKLTKLGKNLDQKLQQLQNDLLALSEPGTEPATQNEVVQVLTPSILSFESLNAPVSRVWAVAKAFQASRSDANDSSFVKTFTNALKKHAIERDVNWSKPSLAPIEFADMGTWTVSNSASATEVSRLLNETSVRPNTIKVVDDEHWDAANMLTFLESISSKKFNLELLFDATFNFPSPENIQLNTQRLGSLLVDHLNRRFTLNEYRGCIDKQIARKLSSLGALLLTVSLTCAQEAAALGCVQNTAKNVRVHIRDGIDTDVMFGLPWNFNVCCEVHCFGRTDGDLLDMIPALTSRESLQQKPVHLLESRITEAGLDRFLGRLRDVGVLPPANGPSDDRYQALKFCVQSEAIDAAGELRITERLKSWGEETFIEWQ